MSIGKRIQILRKKEKLTQLELAEKLNVTDKAVSKWETSQGEPSYQLIIDISKLFNVTIDYLMTGTKDVKNMSLTEKIAINDDVEMYKKNAMNAQELDLYFKEAITEKRLLDYLLEYRSEKVLRYVVEHTMNSYRDILNEYREKIVLFALENKWFDILGDDKQKQRGLYLYGIAILDVAKTKEIIRYSPSSFTASEKLADDIVNSEYMDEESWDFILGNGGESYWSKGLRVILEKAILLKHKFLNKIIDVIETSNSKIPELSKKHRVGEAYSVYSLFSDGLYSNSSTKLSANFSYTPVSKQAVLNAVEIKDFDLADRLNDLTKDKVSDYEMKMFKVNASSKLSKRDKLRESIFEGELINIDKLIATADFDLYEELIKEPATPYELALKYLFKKQFKELYSFSEKYRIHSLGRAIIDGNINLGKYINENDLEKHIELNKKYYLKYPHYRAPKDTTMKKTTILFEDIVEKHTDERFFIKAIETNPAGMDEALMTLVANRGKEFNLQKLLLDAGAKIHSRWVEDDGWGYDVQRDEVDDVATQLLKNQIDILVKMKEEK